MNFDRLERNLCDNILEAQLKIGFDGKPLSLNYTLDSLGNLLGQKLGKDDMRYELFQFAICVRPALGDISVRETSDGFCLTVPPDGGAFVRDFYDRRDFIAEFIEKIRGHCSSVDEALAVFRKYSDGVIVEKIDSDEFQYLVRFGGGDPDEYYYCLSAEEEIDGSFHVSYHRFVKEDYEELGF